MEASTLTKTWAARVAEWKASGERAETFSRRGGYAANTLRWWSSKLKRELAASMSAAPGTTASSAIALARVVRVSAARTEETRTRAIVLDVIGAGVEIAVEPGADATTLAMVLDVVRARGGRS